MKQVIALLVVAGLASFAVASDDANKSAHKADKNSSKAHKSEKKEANASK